MKRWSGFSCTVSSALTTAPVSGFAQCQADAVESAASRRRIGATSMRYSPTRIGGIGTIVILQIGHATADAARSSGCIGHQYVRRLLRRNGGGRRLCGAGDHRATRIRTQIGSARDTSSLSATLEPFSLSSSELSAQFQLNCPRFVRYGSTGK